ncbi:hypothetical protein LCGC14_2776860 [marine sediment metagenome]|uniref:Uncharacterized protein n=1 Tax=marine sediment metagenome TaxID=412755 RepID=A0A0F9BL21_9ZZZZ
MKTLKQILAITFVFALGLGIGQNLSNISWATPYPGGGGPHPINLASDVTGELPHGSTSDDAANVHGLPASVNVLGNRSASGEFIQRLQTDDITVTSAVTFFQASTAITYAVAFSATPIVLTGGTESNVLNLTGAASTTNTTFTMRRYSNVDDEAGLNIGWVALGT